MHREKKLWFNIYSLERHLLTRCEVWMRTRYEALFQLLEGSDEQGWQAPSWTEAALCPTDTPSSAHPLSPSLPLPSWGNPWFLQAQISEDFPELLKVLVGQSCSNSLSWTVVAHQPYLSVGFFSGKNTWHGLPFPPPGDLLDPGIEPTSPALAGQSFCY